ncbi:pyruvate dehydrogenase E2 component (dihydrolipoamide acetyltransferase) [Homoserinimonas aerilata]|uniref:Dihydrolipoamide acetyltransferase component of pyruvate dehydrogenase complex n=1 Tax=Homoserinimonas aerilata TaxID=1162970 RepID=A0A542YEQ4_9MICO|nr:dihydrolipoamide acetyltransferase family protein [Homoserinimonas aerilata]TQL46583.1 pyruvate dehydrogenase E2 component (dihydrolipoamide acetyltransferase) [Homoserinimonas aerilata]
MSASEFLLPDVGEGLTEAEIVSWKVKAGDQVTVNQTLVEIETAKSIVELPSPFTGVVTAVLVEEGATVDVGTPIISVSTGAEPVDAPAPARGPADDVVADTADTISPEDQGPDATKADDKPGAVLVGYGLKGQVASRRGARAAAMPTIDPAGLRLDRVPAASASSVIAKPPIRKLAKDLGVDLSQVNPSGLAGEILREDVVRGASQASVFRNIETPAWGVDREEYIPVKGVRKAIATGMVKSAFTAPHVGVFVDVDATRTMEFVKRLKNSTDFAGVKVSPMLVMAKAMIWAVRRNPTVNSTWTDEQIVVHHYVNFGFAAATPRGLVVPNIKDAQELSLRELAQAIEQMTNVARDGKLQPADMSNGTITVTNIGVFGMDTGTPILNPGEVGIVALGTIKQKPWVVDGEVRPRFVTTLGASFDHRVVDGDVASRFLADVASIIEEPALLLD